MFGRSQPSDKGALANQNTVASLRIRIRIGTQMLEIARLATEAPQIEQGPRRSITSRAKREEG